MPKNNRKKKASKEKKKETPSEFVASMAVVLVTGLFIITFILQAFEIPSSSMEDTLLVGDHVFVDRVVYSPPSSALGPLMPYEPVHRGDIVVFLSPVQPGLYVVKRVIGVPGDHIHLEDGVVYRNGERLDEPYVIRHGGYDPYRDRFPAESPAMAANVNPLWAVEMGRYRQGPDIVVPDGHYFVMGDNRDVSLDSRFWGFVPRAHIIGRPLFIYWSFETPPSQYHKTGLGQRIAYMFQVVIHFFDQTRWNRMFKLVH